MMRFSPQTYRKIFQEVLSPLDITINGDGPHDIQIHNPLFYQRVLSDCSVGLGESYMNGWWDVPQLDSFFARLTKNKPLIPFTSTTAFYYVKNLLTTTSRIIKQSIINGQNKKHSHKVTEKHYDLGNEFYKAMLDPFMQYTCAYYKIDNDYLNQAQVNKLDLVCKKLHLPQKVQPLEKVLELGCGFGGFANFATTNYNCEVVGYNISKEQVTFARQFNQDLPFIIREEDYRNAVIIEPRFSFDKVVSIGLCEHIGPKNYKTLMQTVDACLKTEGLFLLHTIGRNTSMLPGTADRWTTKYIFPGAHVPSAAQITKSAEKLFRLEDVHNFGHDYDKTLMAWFTNFDKSWPTLKENVGESIYQTMHHTCKEWPAFSDDKGERFYRMWKYYLQNCAGAFRSGSLNLFQFVFSKRNQSKKYISVR